MPEDAPIALKPSNLSHEQAAAISFGGTTALDFLLIKGKVQKGEKVLINGASGAVGSAMVQLANYFGAEVTGVCSTTNLDLVKSLGAHKVIDYTKEDFAKNGKKYDIIADIVANAPWSRVSGSLTEKGRLLLVLASLPEMLRAPFVSRKNGKRCIGGVAHEKTEDLNHLAKLAAQGKFTPLIDRTYPMADIVTAHEYVGQGHKKGNVVITI